MRISLQRVVLPAQPVSQQSHWVHVASGQVVSSISHFALGKVDDGLTFPRHPCAAYSTFWSGEAVRLVTSHRADDA